MGREKPTDGAETPETPDTPTPGDNGDFPSSWEEVFQHPRFKQLNERAKAAEAQLEQLREAQQKAEEEKLREQEQWKELAEKRERELEQERLERLRLQVASEAGLPPAMASRLQGDDEDALREDAKRLQEFLKPNAPGVPPAGKRRPAQPITREQLSDPAWVRENRDKIVQAEQEGTLPR